jgi:GNAT superfamily N-acetyltransferase
MPVRELCAVHLDLAWPALEHLAGDQPEERLRRLEELLAQEGPYCLFYEADDGSAAGLAVVEHYQSAWIFVDHVAAIREFLADGAAQDVLLAAITERAAGAKIDQLSRFTTADDPLLPWWYEASFVEYMAAFRRPIHVEGATSPAPAEDEIVIRPVTDLDADWPKLWPLFEKLNQHHASLTGRPLNAGREANSRRDLARELESGDALVMLAEADGRAIATSSAELGETHSDGSRTGFRSRLFVEETWRGRGLSARFEAVALPWFRQHAVSEVERWIVAGNERPRQIWAARGYRPERLLLRKALRP